MFTFIAVKKQILQLNYCKIINSWNKKFSGYIWNTWEIIYPSLFNLHERAFKNNFYKTVTKYIAI